MAVILQRQELLIVGVISSMASDDQELGTDTTDATPMLTKDNENTTARPPGAVARYYTLPKTRYRNIAEVILTIDSIVSLALWISGKNNQYNGVMSK